MPDDSDAVGLTVGSVAARLGVTVRSLHYWDEIALAQPSSRSRSGYRLYTADDIERLRRVIIYRELGLDLESIRRILDDAAAETVMMLRDRRAELADRIDHLTSLGNDLNRMLDAHERGLLLSAREQKAAFGPDWNPQWPAEARQLYGDTRQWQQYAELSASRTPADWRAVSQANTVFEQALSEAMDAGVEPGSPVANALADRHREVFSAYFPISRNMQILLGRMYEADPAYAAHYEGVHTGLASWLRRVIDASARANGIDPDAATWR